WFDGRTAIVTGAGNGMGRAHAHVLAERGATVVALDVDEAAAARVAEEIQAAGGSARSSVTDVSDEAAVQALVEETGRVDILVNNAANFLFSAFERHTTEDFDRSMKVNTYGPYFTLRAVWPRMLEQGYGRIVNISSAAGMWGLPHRIAYAGSKGTLIGV